jgi:hypothetical protein
MYAGVAVNSACVVKQASSGAAATARIPEWYVYFTAASRNSHIVTSLFPYMFNVSVFLPLIFQKYRHRFHL